MSNFCDIQITLAGKDAPLRTSQIVYFSSVIATKNKRQWTIHYSNRYFFLFVFFLLSNQLFYRLKMLRGPLFPKHTFHFISLFCASSINTPETTLVGVGAVKLKKKTVRAILFLPLSFLLFSRICLGRTVNNHNMLQCQFLL